MYISNDFPLLAANTKNIKFGDIFQVEDIQRLQQNYGKSAIDRVIQRYVSGGLRNTGAGAKTM